MTVYFPPKGFEIGASAKLKIKYEDA